MALLASSAPARAGETGHPFDLACAPRRQPVHSGPLAFLMAATAAVIHELTGNQLLQRLLVTDPDRMLALVAGPDTPIIARGRQYIAAQLRRLEATGTALNSDPDTLGELLARLVLSLAVSPAGVLQVDDDQRLAALARATFVPRVLRTAAGPR